MMIHVGYEFLFEVPTPTPSLLKFYLYPSHLSQVRQPERLRIEPDLPIDEYMDCYGNRVGRLVFPAGRVWIWNDAVVADSGQPDVVNPQAQQHAIADLPVDVIPYLLSSRYCEVDRLSEVAWQLFGPIPPGWPRVQAICNWVHEHIQFGYEHARISKTAYDVYVERTGVCRDFMHLAVTLCRCLHIPARCAAGYLGDIGVPPDPLPMDFSAWFEVYLGHRWYTFDARHNRPRVGRILMARGLDATDTAFITSFGQINLKKFTVWTDEVA